jgi:hypothetical protein
LKKKYVEPHNKLVKNIQYKKNIDETIHLYEKLKNIKLDLKMLKIKFEKEKNMMIDTDYSSSIFKKIKNEIAEKENLENFKATNYLSEDLDWFIENEDRILQFYRNKFNEAIRNMVNKYL